MDQHDHVRFVGDPEACAQWLPFARSKFRALDNGREPTFKRHFAVGDVIVILHRAGGQKIITIMAEEVVLAGLLCHPAGDVSGETQRYRVTAHRSAGGWRWRSQAIDPGEYLVNYGTRGWTNGREAVSWHSDPIHAVGEFLDSVSWLFYKGQRYDLYADFDDRNYHRVQLLPALGPVPCFQHPQILGASVVGGYVIATVFVMEGFYTLPDVRPRVEVLCWRKRADNANLLEPHDVLYSEAMLGMPYRVFSGTHTFGLAPNPVNINSPDAGSWHRAADCQGFSLSPSGRAALFFANDKVRRFDFGVDQEGAVTIDDSEYDHPAPAPFIRHYKPTAALFLRDECIGGRFHVGAQWAVADGQESFTWITYEVDYENEVSDASGGWALGEPWSGHVTVRLRTDTGLHTVIDADLETQGFTASQGTATPYAVPFNHVQASLQDDVLIQESALYNSLDLVWGCPYQSLTVAAQGGTPQTTTVHPLRLSEGANAHCFFPAYVRWLGVNIITGYQGVTRGDGIFTPSPGHVTAEYTLLGQYDGGVLGPVPNWFDQPPAQIPLEDVRIEPLAGLDEGSVLVFVDPADPTRQETVQVYELLPEAAADENNIRVFRQFMRDRVGAGAVSGGVHRWPENSLALATAHLGDPFRWNTLRSSFVYMPGAVSLGAGDGFGFPMWRNLFNGNPHYGRVRDARFVSVPLVNDTALSYMTDNPELSGVFPDEVDLSGRFDPIVPY